MPFCCRRTLSSAWGEHWDGPGRPFFSSGSRAARGPSQVTRALDPHPASVADVDLPADAAMPTPIEIHVWSDYVCPFCMLEEPVLDEVAAQYGDGVSIRWRAYELRPDPVPTLEPDGEYLRTTWARAVYPMAERRGLPLRLPPVQPRSRLAHEAERFAREEARGSAMRRALFHAFFVDGRDIGDLEVLLDIARGADVDADRLREALDTGRHTDAVRVDQHEAQMLGVHGVPAMLIGRAGAPVSQSLLVSGAQPFEAVRGAIESLRSG
jgi:predicted DsbA family dithiol-disulfide isomerase